MRSNTKWKSVLTWILPLVIFQICTQISYWTKVSTGFSLFYLSAPVAIILIYWWGPRILVGSIINNIISASLWGHTNPILYPVIAIPEAVFALSSWFLFIKIFKGKCWFPNVRQFLYFLFIGIIFPLFIYKIALATIFILVHQLPVDEFWSYFTTTSLTDFIIIFWITIPALYFLTYRMQNIGYTAINTKINKDDPAIRSLMTGTYVLIELVSIVLILILMSRFIEFGNYWFLYGIVSLYSAIRFGFGISIIVNSFVLLITYVLPPIITLSFTEDQVFSAEMIRIQVGSILLYIFSLVTGRVISDSIVFEERINRQNEELKHVNDEMDRFVYSVSHDLSAPLKSIQGLVNISRVEEMNDRLKDYIDHIELSTQKLEGFISKVLDFTRNERKEIIIEPINLKSFFLEIIEANNALIKKNQSLVLDTSHIQDIVVFADKMRLQILISNLLSNAIKYHRPEVPSKIILVANATSNYLIVKIQDNGEGIRDEIRENIYDMFYRGSQASDGSGLGLYISKEVVQRLNGAIDFRSKPGEGTTFIVTIPV